MGCPARAGQRAAAASWHKMRAQGYGVGGTVAGSPRPGELGRGQCMCARLAGQPASQNPGSRSSATSGGGRRDLWVQAPLGLAGGPSPGPGDKATTPRIELWGLQSQVCPVG